MDAFSSRYRHLAFSILGLITLGLGTAIALPFVPAILWATVLSILLYPLYQRMTRSLAKIRLFVGGRAETVAAILTTLLCFVVIVIPFVVIGAGVYSQGQNITAEIAGQGGKDGSLSFDSVVKYLDEAMHPLAQQVGASEFSLSKYVAENRPQIIEAVRQPLTKAATQTAVTILTLVIALLTMFFMLRDSWRAKEPALDLIPVQRDRAEEILNRIAETVRAVFVGTVLVAIIQGAIMGGAYAYVGVPNSLLLGVFSILLCIIPLLGAPVIYLPVGLFFLAQGNMSAGLIILGVGGLVVSQIDNILKPIFIAGRANLHPMLVFFAILGGVIVVGPIGVMAGPMLLTILLAMAEVVRERLKSGDA